ncbi:hypothetical protein ATI61_106161 [Archangium gephyra]|uniref:Uncharacterized protein n=1 Tax=Archangium gephyra TaxID=48 RepID=A0AAC8Q0L4_9BACT|nr:hypothetical protein [Archangium gephyra]AKI98772.1 Hypothetical protein AA314_00399 [Archangium gephyra]REG30692.1 hypothetical protein ATI61_106161 [Archangium gephyra]
MDALSRCAVMLWLVGSGPVLAGPRPESRWGLRWNAEVECLQAGPLARAVEERLGRTVFGPEPELLVDGVLERGRPSGWRARLPRVDARGTVLGRREVSPREEACPAIERRLLWVRALEPSAALAGPPAAEPPPEPPVEPASEPSRLAFTAAVTGAVGTGFGLVPGVAGTLWSAPGTWNWLVRMTLSPYESYTKDGSLLSLVRVGGETGVCSKAVGQGPWRLSGCGTAGFTLVFAYSQGDEQGRLELLPRGDVGGRARLERILAGNMSLHVGLGVGYGWLRPTVRLLEPDGTVEDVRLGGPVQASLDLGMTFAGP